MSIFKLSEREVKGYKSRLVNSFNNGIRTSGTFTMSNLGSLSDSRTSPRKGILNYGAGLVYFWNNYDSTQPRQSMYVTIVPDTGSVITYNQNDISCTSSSRDIRLSGSNVILNYENNGNKRWNLNLETGVWNYYTSHDTSGVNFESAVTWNGYTATADLDITGTYTHTGKIIFTK